MQARIVAKIYFPMFLIGNGKDIAFFIMFQYNPIITVLAITPIIPHQKITSKSEEFDCKMDNVWETRKKYYVACREFNTSKNIF